MAQKLVSYLGSLKFDPRLWNTWWAKYVVQIRLVIMLILLIVVLGFFGYKQIPRRLNPEINIAIVIVNTTLPGASPEDVEQLVTVPLEDAVNNVDGIDTMTSLSTAGNSTITIQFRSSVNGDKARTDVKSAVDTVSNLPKDALDPRVIKLDFADEPVWTFAITAKSDIASLMRFSKVLKDRIGEGKKIDRVTTSGLDNQNIEVTLIPEKVQELGLSPQQISQAIRVAAGSYPAGNVETQGSSFSLSIEKDIVTVDDIRNVRIEAAGNNIRLGDVAKVAYISNSNQNLAFLASKGVNTTPTVQFFVYRAKTANIDEAQSEAQKIVDKSLKEYGGQFKATTVTNFAEEISKQFNDLTREFSTTILLVFALLLIFLGLRQAVISSLTVPLTFFSSFAIIYALGLSLNFLTMFSFLIALGVLIDDAIVVVAAMTRYYATGKFTAAETGVLVWRDFIIPLISTAITTIWAFVPLLLAGGIIGEFIKTIPIVVTVTMASSTLIAIFITLPLMIVFLKPQFPRRVKVFLKVLGFIVPTVVFILLVPKNPFMPIITLVFIAFVSLIYKIRKPLYRDIKMFIRKSKYLKPVPGFFQRVSDKGLLDIEVVARKYMSTIEKILISKHGKRNTIIAVFTFTLVAYLLVPFGLVKTEFFPSQDSDLLYVSVDMPSGTNLSTNRQEMLSLESKLKNTPEVVYIVGETGQSYSSSMGRTGANNTFLLTLHLTDHKKRRIESKEIAQNLRKKYRGYTAGTFTVQEQSGGPPAGADAQITILGDDPIKLDQYANKAAKFLESVPGTTNINKSIKPGTSKLVFKLDKDKLAENNLTVDQVAFWLRTYASGLTLDTIKFGKEEKDIVFKMAPYTQTPEDLGRLSIPVSTGPSSQKVNEVPILSLGKMTLATNPTSITREEGKRAISVTASVVAGHNIQDINKKLTGYADKKLNLEEGYSWKTGGVNEENQKSVNSILLAMILSFLLIFVTMVIEFRSFRQTFIALMFIPLSVSGVFYIFALTGTPLSFPALIGILALFGIVVRHAIVVIEKINDDRREGMSAHDAVVDAAGNRLEPVVLTSLAAIVGLIPITISDPLWRGLGGAIISGLLFSATIKLFFIPVMYTLMYPEEKRVRSQRRT